ncbi:hypothetical protein RIF29_29990 [Crotalaria pallida]|uniref:Uncharacterized protein n=1 Tax=Crotalaria pallida TaxID=3830 RepID=A0AAN9HWD0_CROPI
MFFPFSPLGFKEDGGGTHQSELKILLKCHSEKIRPMLQTLQAKNVLFPEDLRLQISFPSKKPFSVLHYIEVLQEKFANLKEQNSTSYGLVY